MVIIDGRNVIDPEASIRGGFTYKGTGRGDRNSYPFVCHRTLKKNCTRYLFFDVPMLFFSIWFMIAASSFKPASAFL